MKHKSLTAFALTLSLGYGSLLCAEPQAPIGRQFEGVLSQITASTVILDRNRSFKFDLKKAKCFDFRGDKTTCETLIDIGYADKARITVVDDVVQRVDILKLQQ